jgi:hypothetical protein
VGPELLSRPLGHRTSIYLPLLMFIIISVAISQLFLTAAVLGSVRVFSTATLKFILEMSSGEWQQDTMFTNDSVE